MGRGNLKGQSNFPKISQSHSNNIIQKAYTYITSFLMIFFHRILINFGIKGNWKFPHSTQSCYFKWALLKYYFNKGYDSKQRMIIVYIYINTNEIPGERLHKNMISSHVKITCYLHTWNITIAMAIINCAYYCKNLLKWNGLVFHWCLYNKHYMASWRYEICLLMLKKYFTHWLCSLNIFQHSKINFVSPHSHVISSIYWSR